MPKLILAEDDIRRAVARMAHEVIERNRGTHSLSFVGIHRRGVPLAERLAAQVASIEGDRPPLGSIDITLYRDDLTRIGYAPQVHRSHLPFSVDDRVVVLVDDVLFTGRTIRAAMDALIDYGRPRAIQLAVLVDRGHRELPVRADYVGKNIPTAVDDDVRVRLRECDGEDAVYLAKEAE